ncbi:MAG: TIGR00725 family protein [Anaerolineales bacterium]|jgi:hypothetical protein
MNIVSVIGQGDSTEAQEAQAFELGKLIAEAGHAIVCGGMGGVMQAVSRGASEHEGLCIGLLPGYKQSEGNPYLTLGIPTGLGHVRNVLVARAAGAVVAIGGGYGTLSEIAFALTMGKTVIGLNTWSAESHAGILAEIIKVQSPEEAMIEIEKVFNEGGNHTRGS